LHNQKTKISIVDNGIGIPKDEIPKIFNTYYQINNSERQLHKGLGLGLAFVREAVNRLPNHQIKVWSNCKSITKINVLLNTAFQSNVALSKSFKAADSDVLLQIMTRPKLNLRVLLLEDDPSVRSFIIEALQIKAALVDAPKEFNNVLIRSISPDNYDLIISDVNLPQDVN
jgi:hypothetical protein